MPFINIRVQELLKNPIFYREQKTAGADFLDHVGSIEICRIVDELSKIKFFSLTMDGITDDGSVEQETLYVRYCDKGTAKQCFHCIGEPESSSSSQDLFNFIEHQMEKHEIDTRRIVGFGSDGISNMTGYNTGLVTRLRGKYSGLVSVHCLVHRLELAFKSVEDLKTHDKLVTSLKLAKYIRV